MIPAKEDKINMKSKETRTISVIIPVEIKEALDDVAKKEERTLSWVVRKAIEEYLNKKEN